MAENNVDVERELKASDYLDEATSAAVNTGLAGYLLEVVLEKGDPEGEAALFQEGSRVNFQRFHDAVTRGANVVGRM